MTDLFNTFIEKLAEKQQSPKVKPGIYLGSRKVNYLNSPLLRAIIPGRHQFYVLIPKDPKKFKGKLRDLGNGVKGYVMGAYQNRYAHLYTKEFQKAETTAAKEWLTGEGHSGFAPEVKRINVRGKNLDKTIHLMIRMQQTFKKKTRKEPIKYNFTSSFGGLNSNAWAQSVGEYVGLKRRLTDFPGIDPGKFGRIPKPYFGLKDEK